MHPVAVEPATGRLSSADLPSAHTAGHSGRVRAGSGVRTVAGSGAAGIPGRTGRKAEAARAVLTQVHCPYPLTDPHRTSCWLIQPRLRSAGC
jgi:hypothetical protein